MHHIQNMMAFVDSCQNSIMCHTLTIQSTCMKYDHFIAHCFKCCAAGRDVKNTQPVLTHTSHTTWYSPRLDQISYRMAFYEEIWLRAQASCNLNPECLEFPRSRIYFAPDACVLDLQASGQLKDFMSDVLFNLTRQTRFSWFLDCHKY